MTKELLSEELQYIEKLEKFLDDARSSLGKTPEFDYSDLSMKADYIQSLKEEIKVAKPEDLPALYQQLNLQFQLLDRKAKPQVRPSLDSPFFGHMKIKEEGKIKDYLIGHVSYRDAEYSLKIIDWKAAPLAQVFYQNSEGEEFDLEVGDDVICGEVIESSVITIKNKSLIKVERNSESYFKINGSWLHKEQAIIELSGGQGKAIRSLDFGTGATNLEVSEVTGLLDEKQHELIKTPHKDSLLVIGGAGSGKTTVALHRVQHLVANRYYSPRENIVLVPNEGLIKLSKKLLKGQQLEKVKVKGVDPWIESQARNLFSNLPKFTPEDSPTSSRIIKRQQSIIKLIEFYYSNEKSNILSSLDSFLDTPEKKHKASQFKKLPFAQFLHELNRIFSGNIPAQLKLKEYRKERNSILFDFFDMFTNRKHLEDHLYDESIDITKRMIEGLFQHSSKLMQNFQMFLNSEKSEEHAKVLPWLDIEDYAILIVMQNVRRGKPVSQKGRLARYRHQVLDEAQELSPLEREIFKLVAGTEGVITVAGDAGQQIDPSISFTGWRGLLDSLGLQNVEENKLNISYRSPQTIIDFSHKVLGAPEDQKPQCKNQGVPVRVEEVQHLAHCSLVLFNALKDLTTIEPNASIAIICANEANATHLYDKISELGNTRLIENADFSFRPGIDVTTVEQVRGLEFDYVIVPDCDASHYPDNLKSRKRLYLASTRAIHQLWVLHGQFYSPLIQDYT